MDWLVRNRGDCRLLKRRQSCTLRLNEGYVYILASAKRDALYRRYP